MPGEKNQVFEEAAFHLLSSLRSLGFWRIIIMIIMQFADIIHLQASSLRAILKVGQVS